MKKAIFLFLGLAFVFNVLAMKVDTVTARVVAVNFLQERISLRKGAAAGSVRLRLAGMEKSADTVLFYIFNRTGEKGFVLVSADDRLLPALAYSTETSWTPDTSRMPGALKEWLQTTGQQIRYAMREKTKQPLLVKKMWQRYLSAQQKGTSDLQEVAPLLSVKWNQGRYYNAFCPEDPAGRDGHVWVGCVAVAMAQVMKYWSDPEYGSGQHSYNHYIYGLQSADFAHTRYAWDSMPDALSDYNDPVARLMYHCGVSVNMSYGTSGSSAYTASTGTALKEYFDYSRKITSVSKGYFTGHAWDSLVRAQLDLGQPLIYAGGRHAFNIDGYQDSSYFHVNWGWGGAYNGYYYLDDLTPGGYDFTSGQRAVINIRPGCGEAPVATDTLTALQGRFSDNGGSGANYYNCSDSRILIRPAGASSVLLNFRKFKTVSGQDSLYIYDGDGEAAPLLAVFSGDTLPAPVRSTGGSVFLRFVSNAFTTDEGYEVEYTCVPDDAGVRSLLLPDVRTCGRAGDSIRVVVKNFGINAQPAIPVKVEVQTPRGAEVYTATLGDTLASDAWDTLFVGGISTLDPGTYAFTCYTLLPGDTMITDNDTLRQSLVIKIPESIPFYENVDDLGWDMKDWTNAGTGYVYISGGEEGNDREGKERNAFFAGMTSLHSDHFFYYDRLITGVNARTGLRFDYRIMNGQLWPPQPDTLNGEEKIYVLVARGCSYHFDTVFTIDRSNHIPDSLFRTVFIPLHAYAGDDIMIGFATAWDSLWSNVEYDNILVSDSLHDNRISGGPVCRGEEMNIGGLTARGSIGPLSYRWEESSDGHSWRVAVNNQDDPHYFLGSADTSLYYRRIVRDTLGSADTSNVVYMPVIPWPAPQITADTAICAGDTVTLEASGGESYHWNTGISGDALQVSPQETTEYTVIVTNGGQCALDTSVTVTVHPLPSVSLGEDTTACAGESITFDAGDFYGYRWNTGSAGRYLTVSTAGHYSVSVTDGNGCENSDTVYVDFTTCTGIDTPTATPVIVYPNPTRGRVTVSGLKDAAVIRLEVVDAAGRILISLRPEQDEVQIDLKNAEAGICLIRFWLKNHAVKVVKVRKE